jgi:predicted RNase H-like HicB family nuclease
MSNHYEIVVPRGAGDGCFLAEVPELPSLITDGPTRQEALRNAEEMIDADVETARREARPLPEPKGRLAFA